MPKDYTNVSPVGQFDRMACWAACLSWWLKAVSGGRPPLSQAQLIAEFDYLCDDDGGLPPSKFKNNVCKDARFNISMGYFTASKYVHTGLPIADEPVIIVYNYPTVGGTHMNVIFDKQRQGGGWTVNCMEPFSPFPGKDGQRTGKFERRATSHFLGSQEIGLAWPTVTF